MTTNVLFNANFGELFQLLQNYEIIPWAKAIMITIASLLSFHIFRIFFDYLIEALEKHKSIMLEEHVANRLKDILTDTSGRRNIEQQFSSDYVTEGDVASYEKKHRCYSYCRSASYGCVSMHNVIVAFEYTAFLILFLVQFSYIVAGTIADPRRNLSTGVFVITSVIVAYLTYNNMLSVYSRTKTKMKYYFQQCVNKGIDRYLGLKIKQNILENDAKVLTKETAGGKKKVGIKFE